MGSIETRSVQLLAQETPDFISSDQWLHNSPDLNPVDYKIWSVLQEQVYTAKNRDIDELRNRITDAWERLDESVIDCAIRQWRHRCRVFITQSINQ